MKRYTQPKILKMFNLVKLGLKPQATTVTNGSSTENGEITVGGCAFIFSEMCMAGGECNEN